jgi:D-serine deaminase-like pyridoxal phosphate-dependent protein
MGSLSGEIAGCLEALDELRKLYTHDRVLAISVGASPQAIAMQNLEDEASWSGLTSELQQQLRIFSSGEVEGAKVALEIHAGVYSIMDIQQVATRSKESMKSYEDEIALSVIAEVVSVYNDGERKQPEALIAVGTLGLGREPCQGYPGWGVVSSRSTPELAECERRLIVARISQEHAVLTWDVPSGEDATTLPPIPLQVGQSVFVYPNHACITGAMYKSYLVVDSLEKGSECQVRAVWDRTGGW